MYEDTGGGRRSDSGSVQVQRQMPVFTQSAPDYDVLVAADENEVFAGYLPYRTWDPRPVVGSAGLRPTSWDPSHELWGAAQLQNRFERLFKRGMNARDNQAWVAMRMIGDAVAHTRSADPKTVHDDILSPDFAVAGFKGQKLTLRDWNQQLRQPILLTDGRGTVSVSPQEGFPAPDLRARHPRLRSAGDQMQASMKRAGCAAGALALAGGPWRLSGPGFGGDRLHHQREGQFDLGHRPRQARGHAHRQDRPKAARHRAEQGRCADVRLPRRRRHHRDYRHEDVEGGRRTAVRPRSRAIAREPGWQIRFRRQRKRRASDRNRHRDAQGGQRISGRRRARRRGGQSRRLDRRQHFGNDQHGPPHRLAEQEGGGQHSRSTRARATPNTTRTARNCG